MIRVLNFLCVAVTGLSILALYHVSESTRLARIDLAQTNRAIETERNTISVLETEWERVASPAQIALLAARRFDLDSTATVQLSSLELLPRRGEEMPLAPSPIRRANAVLPSQDGQVRAAAVSSGAQ